MLAFRLIARLDIRNEHLIKTIRMEGVRRLGDPYEFASRYDREGIDEILYMDVVASLYGRNSLLALLDRTVQDVFCPVTVGGGIRSTEDVQALLRAGADKVAINTAAVDNPSLITEIANKFGSQIITLQLDVRDGQAYTNGGRQPTGRKALEWAREAVDRGAGEILVTSVDREGTSQGLDMEFCSQLQVPVPVVACGGVGRVEDILAAASLSGVAMAGALHFNKMKLADIRHTLHNAGIACRHDTSRGPEPDGQGTGIRL